jgi:hypothetical protein
MDLQLSTFVKEQVIGKRDDISKLFYKILRSWSWTRGVKPGMKDDAMYKLLQSHIPPTDTKAVNPIRANARIREIHALLGESGDDDEKFETYLDYGADDCTISEMVGEEFALDTFMTDVENWALNPIERVHKENFKTLRNGKIPFARRFDLVTMFMVLHHLTEETLDKVMEDLRKHCKRGAIVVLREHDTTEDNHAYLCDIEHYLHGVTNGVSYKQFLKHYYADYHPCQYWRQLFEEYGFTFVHMTEPRGATRYTLMSFRWDKPVVSNSSPEQVERAERERSEEDRLRREMKALKLKESEKKTETE